MLTIIVPVIDLDTSCGKVQSFYLYSKLGRILYCTVLFLSLRLKHFWNTWKVILVRIFINIG